MFCSRSVNKKIYKLHERALTIIYDDYNSEFEELLTKDGSFSIHNQNIQTLDIEMYKVRNGLLQTSVQDLFDSYPQNNFYNLRSKPDFRIPRVNTTLKGTESVRYLGPIIWNNIPIEIRRIREIELFKSEIRKWKPLNCPCRICKHYVNGLGFINVA